MAVPTIADPSPPQQGAVNLRLGLFFDGTGNHRDNSDAAVPGEGVSYANAPTNVALLQQLYGAPHCSAADGATAHARSCYIPGIGTRGGADDSLYGQATGQGETGMHARIAQGIASLAALIQDWRTRHSEATLDRLVVDVFGFSRGAAAARHVVNDLLRGRDSQLAQALREVDGLGDAFDWPARLHVGFVGLFDTVAAMVSPLVGDFSPANDRFGGLQLAIPASLGTRVLHLVALDEHRHNFPLVATPWDIGVPGAHSDVGGGYPAQVVEQVYLSKPRSCQVPQRTPAAQTAAYRALQRTLEREPTDSRLPGPTLHTWEHPLPYDPQRQEGREKRVYVALRQERDVLGGLSQVYLTLMHEVALAQGVPFAPVPLAWAPPLALQDITAALRAYVVGRAPALGLSEAQRRLLEHDYIHCSAHWNPVLGARESSLDTLYVHRPAAQGRRVFHPGVV